MVVKGGFPQKIANKLPEICFLRAKKGGTRLDDIRN